MIAEIYKLIIIETIDVIVRMFGDAKKENRATWIKNCQYVI